MKLSDLPTPCLVLDRVVLRRNLDMMARAVGRLGVALRPHMKTAKSVDVARLALGATEVRTGGITVSTLAEAEYFSGHGITDILYAVGITPQKLDQVAKLNEAGAAVMVVTDDLDCAHAIAGHPRAPRVLIEVDCGEARGGIDAESDLLIGIAAALGNRLAGIMTHAGHSYLGRSLAEMQAMAETERAVAVRAASRLRAAGHACPIVSVGSSPTALHARSLEGVTETRPGVYMFGDLFQAEIGTVGHRDLAVTVLASVIGRRPQEGRVLVDAGAMALSKDRSTQSAPVDWGFGHVRGLDGSDVYGRTLVERANQEHGVIGFDPSMPSPDLHVGDRVRIAPNHVCMTAAQHDRYFVVDGDDEVVAVWPRINGW